MEQRAYELGKIFYSLLAKVYSSVKGIFKKLRENGRMPVRISAAIISEILASVATGTVGAMAIPFILALLTKEAIVPLVPIPVRLK